MISPQDTEYRAWPKEARFRYHERLAILGFDGQPTPNQDSLARADAKRWIDESESSNKPCSEF